MVGLHRQLVGVEVGSIGERAVDAAPHLLRRLDREGEAEDLARTRAPLDQLDDRQPQGVGLARPGAGRDPHRPPERGEVRHRGGGRPAR